MKNKNIKIPPMYGPTPDKGKLTREIQDLALKHGITDEVLLATMIQAFIDRKTPVGRLLKFVIDTASDEFIAEEFYHKYKDILTFLANAGSTNDEVRFLAYHHHHPELFICKHCGSNLVGMCPSMLCFECGRSYYYNIENISDGMCKYCAFDKLRKSSDDDCRRRKQIHIATEVPECQ
jgi:hypothetical protein